MPPDTESAHVDVDVDVDVVIVGGGPAGSSAAISCAGQGLRVVLYESQPFPRDRPGETLHPGVQALLARIGVERAVLDAGFLRHGGIRVAWDGPLRHVPFGADADGPWLGFQATRAEFDMILLRRAVDLGVRVRQPAGALHPFFDGGRVAGVIADGAAVSCRCIIDASGSRHWSHRHLGVRIVKCSAPLTAWYGCFEGHAPGLDGDPLLTADAGGWTWIAQVGEGVYQWTRLDLDRRRTRPGTVPASLRHLTPRGAIRGADVTWRVLAAPAGPGYFVAGDAAAVLDPASSHGVLRAIMMGMMAADGVARVCRSGDDPATIEAAYCRWVIDSFSRETTQLAAHYRRLPQPPAWVA